MKHKTHSLEFVTEAILNERHNQDATPDDILDLIVLLDGPELGEFLFGLAEVMEQESQDNQYDTAPYVETSEHLFAAAKAYRQGVTEHYN